MKGKEDKGLSDYLNGFMYACTLLDKDLFEAHFNSAKQQYLRTQRKNNDDTE